MRGIRKIERAAEKELEDDAEDAEAKVVRDYCAAVRGALTDDALPPLVASGLKLQDRLSRIAASLDQVVATAGTLPGGLKRLQQVLRRGLEETAALFPAVRASYQWVKRRRPDPQERGGAAGEESATADGATAGADAPGSGRDDRTRGAGGFEAVREGDSELLAGLVSLLRVVGPAADE